MGEQRRPSESLSVIQVSEMNSEFVVYRSMWKASAKHKASLPPDYPGWPDSGIAVMEIFPAFKHLSSGRCLELGVLLVDCAAAHSG